MFQLRTGEREFTFSSFLDVLNGLCGLDGKLCVRTYRVDSFRAAKNRLTSSSEALSKI